MTVDTYARLLEKRKIHMKRKMIHNGISVALLGALLIGGANIFASCQRGFEEKNAPGDGEAVEVSVGFSEDALTKSSVANVDAVNTVQIAAYRTMDGMLYDTANDPANLKLKLLAGYDYRIFSLVNCGASAVSWPQSLSQVEALSFSTSSATFTGGAPMAGDVTVTVNGNMSLTLTPKRMLSKWTVKFVDQDALGYAVKFVRMRHSASNATPWKYGEGFNSADGMTGTGASKATAVFDTGDYGTAADIAALTTSSGAVFYVMENARGTVSGFTGSAQMADLQASPEAATTYGLYTFLEIGLDFPAGADYERDPMKTSAEADVIYRVFLRKDAVNNLSVIRNTQMTLTLTGTRAGIDGTTLDWSIEDNTVPSGNKITGTVTPLAWNTDMAGAGQTADNFTPTIYNVIARTAGVAEWKKYGTMGQILADAAVMSAIAGSDDALYLVMTGLEQVPDIRDFEARVDELGLGNAIDNTLSGSAYYTATNYPLGTGGFHNTAAGGSVLFDGNDIYASVRSVVIYKGAEWRNNGTVGNPKITVKSMLSDITFVDDYKNIGSLSTPYDAVAIPYRASFCGMFMFTAGNVSGGVYPTYVGCTVYSLNPGCAPPSGTIYAKADRSDRSNKGCNLVANTADMTSASFKKFGVRNASTTEQYTSMLTTSGSLYYKFYESDDLPALPPEYVGNPLTKSVQISNVGYGMQYPLFVLADNVTLHDRHFIVSCYVKTDNKTDLRLCIRDAGTGTVLTGSSLVEKVGTQSYGANEEAYTATLKVTPAGATADFYGKVTNVSSGTWTRISTAFTLTEAGAGRPLQIGLQGKRRVDDDGSADVYVAAFMVEPGTVDHGYVPYWNEGRGFSADVTDVYTDKKEAWSAGCRWYAVTRDASPDLEGDLNTAPYKHNWDWQPWTPVVHSM